MKPVRTGLAAAAVAALMIVPATAAHAASSTVVVTPDDLNGWVVAPFPAPTSVPFAFVDGPATIGSGSLQFGPVDGPDPRNKLIVNREQIIPAADFESVVYDFYIDPTAANKNPNQFYLNVYVQTPVDVPNQRFSTAATTTCPPPVATAGTPSPPRPPARRAWWRPRTARPAVTPSTTWRWAARSSASR